MISPSAERDWFTVSPDLVPLLAPSPGLLVKKGLVIAHRSLLAVLPDHPEVSRLLAPRPVDVAARDALDARTEARGGWHLRPHQHAGVEFMRARRGTLLADEQRVGKTGQALMTHDPASGPLLVICPLMVREVWLSWIRRVFPGEDVGILAGKVFNRAEAQKPIVVGHYDILYAWGSDLKYGTVIFDEAHGLSNARAKRTIAAALVGSNAQRVLALTGTPVWNMPISAHPILQLVAPGAWGTRHDFGQRYCDPEPTAHGVVYKGSSHQEELKLRLAEVMLRRMHRDVQVDLPVISRDVLVVDLTPKERRRLDVLVEKMREPGARTSTIGTLARYRSALADVKVEAAVAHAAEIAAVEPLVVWTWHKRVAEMIHQRLPGSHLVTGDTPVHQREQHLAAWKRDRSVLVATIAVGQVGIDLSHARRELFVEVDYTPAVVAQAEMRTYSPSRPMYVTFLVADHPVDRRVVDTLAKKLAATTPLGVDAAQGAIDILREVLSPGLEVADLERLARDMIKGMFE